MKKSKCILWVFGICMLLPQVHAQKTAAVKATSRSLHQEPITWVSSGIPITTFFTTFDGTSGLPLFDTNSGAFSSELRVRNGQPTTYECDYLNFNLDFGILAYGFSTMTVPNNDLDANTIPDIFQFDRAAMVSYIGAIQSDFPSVTKYDTRGTLSKQLGEYSISNFITVTDAGGAVILQGFGSFSIGHFTGIANYNRAWIEGATNELELTLTGVLFDSIPNTYFATTSFTILNSEQILIPEFTAICADGPSIQVRAVTLTRQGNKYHGDFEINDGNFSTSWRDYTEWSLELTDSNDTDADGIPDLTDAFELPIVTSHPQSHTVTVGSTVHLSATATGEPPPSYQWQKDGLNISGATKPLLTLEDVQLNQTGAYRAVISNSLGTVSSLEANVIVNPIARPQLTIVSAGDGNLRVSWPSSFSGYVLEISNRSAPPRWSVATGSVTKTLDQNVISLVPDLKVVYLRLRQVAESQ